MSISQRPQIACLKSFSLSRWKEDLNQGKSFPKLHGIRYCHYKWMLMRDAWVAQSEGQAILHLKVVSWSPTLDE